jgi:predicted hydrolase (HD superfamily)
MRTLDIAKIENEVRSMHLHAKGEPQRKKLLEYFWMHHIVPVVAYSREMADRYGADMEVVHLGALLHDMALIEDAEPHDEIGARKAFEFLIVNWAEKETAEKVRDIVLKHRCKLYVPETLEEKIVATADALAHFFPDFHGSGASMIAREDLSQMRVLDIEKLEKEYADKVFFENERLIFQDVMRKYREAYFNN